MPMPTGLLDWAFAMLPVIIIVTTASYSLGDSGPWVTSSPSTVSIAVFITSRAFENALGLPLVVRVSSQLAPCIMSIASAIDIGCGAGSAPMPSRFAFAKRSKRQPCERRSVLERGLEVGEHRFHVEVAAWSTTTGEDKSSVRCSVWRELRANVEHAWRLRQ